MSADKEAAPVAIEPAGPQDLEPLSHVIADAFFPLAVSRWLIPDEEARRMLFPYYFGIFTEHAGSAGVVLTTRERTAAALWLSAGTSGPPAPRNYKKRLAAVTGPYLARFEVFDQMLEQRHPRRQAYCHLAMLAVQPGKQGQGIGSALLTAQHALFDAHGITSYLEASGPDTRQLYLRHGYTDYGKPIQLPDSGPRMFPMMRRQSHTDRVNPQAENGGMTAEPGPAW